jgi:hypothetical protein
VLAQQAADTPPRNVLTEQLRAGGEDPRAFPWAAAGLYNLPADDPAVDLNTLRLEYAALSNVECKRDLDVVVRRMCDGLERVSVIVAQFDRRGEKGRRMALVVSIVFSEAMGGPLTEVFAGTRLTDGGDGRQLDGDQRKEG